MANFIQTYTEKDKLKHIIVESMITLYCYCILHLFLAKPISLLLAALTALIIGLLKEFADSKNDKHVASRKDLNADVIGILITTIPLIFI